MKTILKQGYWKIISLFYDDKSASIHLRDIARKTKLNENSASIFLKKLENEKILFSKKDGNLKKYGIVKDDLIYSIFTQMDIIKLNSLPNIRKKAILYFLDKLKEKAIIAVLFGSTAKLTYRNDSDIDLLLIVNKKIDTNFAEKYADSQTAININSIQIELDEFKKELKLKEDKVIQSAINIGYPVTNHIGYYREVYDERI